MTPKPGHVVQAYDAGFPSPSVGSTALAALVRVQIA